MGEFRTVTVLFICIHSIHFHTTNDRANPPLAAAFPHSKHHEGHRATISAYANAMRRVNSEEEEAEKVARAKKREEDSEIRNSVEFVDEGFEAPVSSLAPSRSPSGSPINTSFSSMETSSSRIFVSFADGLDAFITPAYARGALRTSVHDTSDISQKLQQAVTTIQTELLNLEGDVNKLVADDKGLLAVAVFGLPPM